MLPRHTLRALSLLLALLAAAGASTQTPAALPQLDVATSQGSQLMKGVALDGQGIVTLLWYELFGPQGPQQSARGRRFSAGDLPQGPDIIFDARESTPAEVVANRRGDSIAIWNRSLSNGTARGVLHRVSPVLPQLTLIWNHLVGDVAVDQAGNFVVAWTVPTPAGSRVFGQRYNADGSKRGPEFNAATTLDGSQHLGGVAMNHLTGEFVIVWLKTNADFTSRRIFGQRFGFTTGRQGGEFQVNTSDLNGEGFDRLFVDVGRAEDGLFVVAWSLRRTSEFTSDVFAQRFNNDGLRLGGEFFIADDTPVVDGFVRLAVAPQGHFAAAWDDGAPPLFMRLYRRDGTPVGPAREMKQTANTPFPGAPEPAFGWNGTFVLGWSDFIGIHDPNDDIWEANYQRFAAAPGVEFCAFRNGHFRCDTNGGGALEVDHLFAVRGGTPLLGDVDGDGRDDYCLFRGTRFDCDSGHDYGAAEFTALFGQAGDTPLLGDLDGDGRDEACVFRGGHFLCDTAHDGGAAEVDLAFGQAGDLALLGDVDGDGRDDACIAGAVELRCDTAGNGGAAETLIALVFSPGLVRLLADVDGDGRDDPCSAGNGAFLCDIARNGGTYDFFRSLEGSPGRPLIGNVDGV
jgi:hypothetical protein